MTDKRPQPPTHTQALFPVAEFKRDPESEGDPRTAPTEPAARTALEDPNDGQNGPYDPFKTFHKNISPQERAALLSLPVPSQSPEDFMNTGERRVARNKRLAASLLRPQIAASVGLVLALLLALGWALWPSREVERRATEPAGEPSADIVAARPASPDSTALPAPEPSEEALPASQPAAGAKSTAKESPPVAQRKIIQQRSAPADALRVPKLPTPSEENTLTPQGPTSVAPPVAPTAASAGYEFRGMIAPSTRAKQP